MQATDDRRARVQQVLQRRGLSQQASAGDASASWLKDRFIARARALFYARMMFLTLGLLILAVPDWNAGYFHFSPLAFVGYFVMLCYSVANYMVLAHARAGRIVTYLTLCLDLVVMVIVIAKPHVGGLQNPLLAVADASANPPSSLVATASQLNVLAVW